MIASRDWAGAAVARLEPETLSTDWLRSHAFAVPLLLRPACSDGDHDDVAAASASPPGAASLAAAASLGMRLPTLPLRVADVAAGVGVDVPVPTLDVARQADGPRGLTLGAFAAYWDDAAARRKRLLNCVSLSLARTRLGADVAPPAAVASLDLLADAWPANDVAEGADSVVEAPRPEVLLYALMSPAGSYTDWHVDFGGSAVWYHLLSGTKVFLLAPPTAANLAAFESWAASPAQARTFLGASLAGTQRVELAAGDTLLIPSGWPHAVATPADAIALGGNFLTPLALPTALRVADVEERLGVEAAARFPAWHALLWRAAARFEARLSDGGDDALSAAEKAGVAALAPRLAQWVEQGGEHAAPKAVGDGAALAAALSARVAAWGSVSVDDAADQEEAARIAAAAAAGDVGAALTLRGAEAEGADVALLRGGRRGERWAAATLASYDTAARSFLVIFAPRTGDRPAMLPERLRLHHRTLRVVSAADAAAAEAAAAARARALSRRATAAAALNANLARTAHALLPLPDAPLIAVKASSSGPYATLGGELVGAWVWRHWPDDGGWFRARVASYDSGARTWRLLYDAGTAAEAEEHAPLAEMTWRELRLSKPKSGPGGAAHAGAAPQEDGSSEESESEEEHAADDVAQRPRPPPLPAHLRVRARREREKARAAAASAAAATSSPPPPAPPPRVTVAGLLRKGLREEASQLAATPSSSAAAAASAPASTPAATAAAAAASRPLSAPLRRFLSAASGGEAAPEALSWASLMKAVLDYARAKGLRGAGGVVRCDGPLQELLGRAAVPAAELSAALRPHFGGSGVIAHPHQQHQQQRLPMPPPPPPPRPAWGHAAAVPAARPYSPTRAFEGERGAAAKRPRSSPPPPPPRDSWDDLQEWRPPPQPVPLPPPPPPPPVFSDDEDDLPEMKLPTWINQPAPPPPPPQQTQQQPWAGWNGGGVPMPQMQAQVQAPAWLAAPPQQQQPAAYAMPPPAMAMMYAPPGAMPQHAPYVTWQQGDMMQQQQQAHPGGFYGPGAGGAYAQQALAWAQQPPPGIGGPAVPQWPPPQPPPPPLPPQWGQSYGSYG